MQIARSSEHFTMRCTKKSNTRARAVKLLSSTHECYHVFVSRPREPSAQSARFMRSFVAFGLGARACFFSRRRCVRREPSGSARPSAGFSVAFDFDLPRIDANLTTSTLSTAPNTLR